MGDSSLTRRILSRFRNTLHPPARRWCKGRRILPEYDAATGGIRVANLSFGGCMKLLSFILSFLVLIVGLTVSLDAHACAYCNKAAEAYKGAAALPANAPITGVFGNGGGTAMPVSASGSSGGGGIRGSIVVKPSGFSNNFFANPPAQREAEPESQRGRALRRAGESDSEISEATGVYQ